MSNYCTCGNPSGMIHGALSGEKQVVVKICSDCGEQKKPENENLERRDT